VFFLRPLKSEPTPDAKDPRAIRAHRESRKAHLTRIHDLLNPGEDQSSISFDNSRGRADHFHYHDEHPSEKEAEETASLHAAVVKHQFPNAKVKRSRRYGADVDDHELVSIKNLNDLKPRKAGNA